MTILFAHLTAFFMKWAMYFSHLKFMSAVATGKVGVVAHHYVYKNVMHVARPMLMWRPI